MSINIMGWDIGGAHLKAAMLTDGEIVQIIQQPCPLWKGLVQLEYAVNAIVQQFPFSKKIHAITMTGELVDFFDNRDAGVAQIIAAMQTYFPNEKIFVYAGLTGFIESINVTSLNYLAIASANWLASASVVAQKTDVALFVDVGSTTTDILLCANHAVQARGFTDYQRLQTQELVYTGIVRTAVMAVSQNVFFEGEIVAVMAEYFATLADVYRLTGDLNEAHDQTETADGAAKNPLASAKRLLRMIGYEADAQGLETAQRLALQFKYLQKQQIQHACLRQLSRKLAHEKLVVVGAGIGRFLVQQIATDLGFVYADFANFFPKPLATELSIADCAPAVAVAYLLFCLKR